MLRARRHPLLRPRRCARVEGAFSSNPRKGTPRVILAADYPFLNILWTMIIFFAWVIWIWIAITVLVDVFRRHDIGGVSKAGWVILVIVVPFLGVLIYLLANHDGMAKRSTKQAEAQKA